MRILFALYKNTVTYLMLIFNGKTEELRNQIDNQEIKGKQSKSQTCFWLCDIQMPNSLFDAWLCYVIFPSTESYWIYFLFEKIE